MNAKWEGDLGPANVVAHNRRFILGARGSWARAMLAHWVWIAIIAIVVTAAAAIVAELQTPIYRAQAVVAIYPVAQNSTAVQPFVMGTEKGIASSGTVLSIAAQPLGMSPAALQRGLSVSVSIDSDLLSIAFSDPNPTVAQRAAESVAKAYVGFRSWEPPTTKTPAITPPGAVQASVVTDPTLPIVPVSPNRGLIIAVAIVLGLALGIGAALLYDLIDDRLRGPLDLQAQADAPVLTEIPAFDRKHGSPADRLVVMRFPRSAAAERYRNLRTRILQIAAWRRSSMLMVTSGSRGDKTTVAANLAAALALSGRRVILVGADLRLGRSQALLGVDRRPGLADIIDGQATLTETLRWTEVPGLQVLPAGPISSDPSSVLQSPALRSLLTELRAASDFVVIEAPAVLTSPDTAALAELGAMILLVADSRASTRTEMREARLGLAHVREELIGCVLENVGRAERLPKATISSAMRVLNERANGNGGPPSNGALRAQADAERQPTTIHGEV